MDDIDKDPWFSRGWTLQELLAPGRIKFFNKDWKPIIAGDSDKEDKSFVKRISNITGIPDMSLRLFHPMTINRDLRPLAWISERCTTRLEDMAYCLIGIFRLTLLIVYGEGKRAFFRLQMELLQNGNATNLLIWHHGLPSM
jgi:hypothetical protein